jgi:hypothetical protein
MGRHADAPVTTTDRRRTAQLAGLTGGIAWVLASFLDAGTVADALRWVGAVLITVALVRLGLALVKSDVMVLRVFVAIALPTLVWGVVSLLRESTSRSVVDVVFGAAVAVISAVMLTRRSERSRATL